MTGDDVIGGEGAMRPAWSREDRARVWGGTIAIYVIVAIVIGLLAG